MALAPDGKGMLTISRVGSADLWDLTTHELVRTLDMEEMVDARFAGDSKTAITAASTHSMSKIWVWNLAEGRAIRTISPEGALIEAVAVAPAGRSMAVGQDRMLSLWDIASGSRVAVRDDSSSMGIIMRLAFSPDGRRLACAYLGHLRLYDLPALRLVSEWDLTINVGGMAFSPDGRLILLGESERIRVFDVADKKKVTRINQLGQQRSFFQSVAAFRDGHMFATVDHHGNFLIGSLAAGTFIAKGPDQYAERVVISPDQRLAYVGNAYGEIEVYDLSSATSSS
jgi:WD40 repeat protein